MNKLKSLILGVVVSSVVLSATMAHALIIGEPPDFPGTLGNPSLGTLDPGLNTVTGSIDNITATSDDVVPLTVPSGFIITAVDFTVTNYVSPGGATVSNLIIPQATGTSVSEVFLTSNGVASHPSGVFPLTSGVYDFLTAISGFVVNTSANWQINITTAPIPTPSAMLLMGTGLLGLIGYRKWSTNKS